MEIEMKLKAPIITSALLISAMTVFNAAAQAAPLPEEAAALSTDIAPGIHYRASIVDNSVVITTDAGSLTTRGAEFQILDAEQQLVAGFPLTYQRDDKEWPIAATVNGNTATLTPISDPAAGRPIDQDPGGLRELSLSDIALDPTSPAFGAAVGSAAAEVGLGLAVGSLIGTAIGAGIGCIAGGALVGSAVAVPTVGVLAVPGFLGGCLVTGAAGGGVGAIAGTVLVGGPIAVASAAKFFNTINAPSVVGPAPAG